MADDVDCCFLSLKKKRRKRIDGSPMGGNKNSTGNRSGVRKKGIVVTSIVSSLFFLKIKRKIRPQGGEKLSNFQPGNLFVNQTTTTLARGALFMVKS